MGVAKYPTVHRTDPATEDAPAQNVREAEVEKPSSPARAGFCPALTPTRAPDPISKDR